MSNYVKRTVCARCGNPIGYWGRPTSGVGYWKHQRGWHSKKPSCGQKPIPKEVRVKT